MNAQAAGLIGLLGSGETAAAGGRLFETLARGAYANLPPPLRAAVLETPAGFELNSPRVAGRVGDFLRVRLSNYDPQVSVIPAAVAARASHPMIPIFVSRCSAPASSLLVPAVRPTQHGS